MVRGIGYEPPRAISDPVATAAVILATPAGDPQNRPGRALPSYHRVGGPVDSRRETSSALSQTTELTRVKARIKALAEKTVSNGCTEAEAMAAAEMVGRLLERYALSMEEIDVREEHCVQLKLPLGGKRRRPIDGCVTAIARFCDCKVWVSRDEAATNYVFFGFEADTTLAGYLFNVIDHAMRTELLAFRRIASSPERHQPSRCVEKLPAGDGGTRGSSARCDAPRA